MVSPDGGDGTSFPVGSRHERANFAMSKGSGDAGERRRRMRMCWVAASRRRGTGPRPPDQIADLDGVVNSLVYLIVSDVEPREVSTHGE